MKGPCRSLRPPPRIRLCLPNLLRPTVFKPQRTSHPEPPQQWHPLAVLAAPGAKSWTRCAACLGGPPRSSLGGFERAPLPSAICALASSCYSLRTCPSGLPCCSPPPSCCCWRVTAFSSNTLPPTPSSSGRFSSIYASCSWGKAVRRPLPPLFHPGGLRQEQGRDRGLLLPDPIQPGDVLPSRPRRRKVGGVAQGLGDRQHR